MPMDITDDTYALAEDAIRDILFLYVDMIVSYDGFGNTINTGSFAPLEFVDAKLHPNPGVAYGIDLDLLHAGSGVALLCAMDDSWDELGFASRESPLIRNIFDALEAGRFDHLSDIKTAVRYGFGQDDSAFRYALATVYRTHVVGYFAALLRGSTAQGGDTVAPRH
jgi:hypothetical protein